MERQFTKAEAVAFAEAESWKPLTEFERAGLQMFQRRLCMPFEVFHEALEKALGRPVWTHEMADTPALIEEYAKKREPPTSEEIMDKIPAEKRIVAVI